MRKKMLSLPDRAELTILLKKVQRGCSKEEYNLFKLYVEMYSNLDYEITPFNKYVEEYKEKYK